MKLIKAKVTKVADYKLGKNAKEVRKSEEIKEVPTDGTCVRCGTGVTISSNYNSVRIDCHIEYPTTKDKAVQTAEEAWDFVATELTTQLDEAQKLLKKL
jgi:hypothetical protein